MNYWLKVVKGMPPGLRQYVIRKLYRYKTGKNLHSVRFYQNSLNYIYQLNDVYIPAGLLNMFATYNYYEDWVNKLSAWAYKPKLGDIVLDIGAGIGEEVIVFSKMVGPVGKVYSIEANPDIFNVLTDVIILNQLDNVSHHNLAIANENGEMKLHVSDSSFLGGSFEKTEYSVHEYLIRTNRMDEFIKNNAINRIDLLKVNIEGAEKYVIGSIGNEIKKVRHVAISCHDFRFREEGNEFFITKDLVIEFLQDNQFELKFQKSSIEDFNDWVYGVNKEYIS